MTYAGTYAASDLPLIGADALGTVGAETVGFIPLGVTAGVLYLGAKYGKKQYDKYKKSSRKGWHHESARHKVAAYKRRK